MHGREILLPEQHDVQEIIYHNGDSDYATGICGKSNLKEKSHNGYIYARVTKGIYGLPQAGRVAHDALVKHVEPYGYCPSSKTTGLWTHKNQLNNFT